VPWEPVNVALDYRLGEIPLFSRRFSGYANKLHFSRMEAYRRLPDEHVADSPQSRFFFYPTYPVAFEPPRIARQRDWIAYTPYTFNNHYIDIAAIGNFEAYVAGFSSKTRATLLRKVRKFAVAGGGTVDCREFATAHDMAAFFPLARSVSAKTYQERLLDSGLPHNDAFMARACDLADRGGCLGYILFMNGVPAAYMLSFCKDGVLTYDHVGYDPALKALSPGTVLQFEALKAIFSKDWITMFDFTEGEGEQKRLFGRACERCAKTYFLHRSVPNELAIRLHAALGDGVTIVGRALDAIGAKALVRRFVRRVA
jgi:CelD/BcsL family acetyltransferase involved in cellulose biosynthesis